MEKPHKRLEVWKLAMELVSEVYGVTESFPVRERYSLTDQIRRAAISIPSNIAEGAANKEGIRQLSPYGPGFSERTGHAAGGGQEAGLSDRSSLGAARCPDGAN